MSPEEVRRIRNRAYSKRYYESHNDAVRTRIREHAHGKRQQLDDALDEIRVVVALIFKGNEALAVVLKTLLAPHFTSGKKLLSPKLTKTMTAPEQVVTR
jgi:hypothetical protein